MTITIEVHEDDAIRFKHGVATDELNGIRISQSLRGEHLYVDFQGKTYRVDNIEIATKICEQVRR